MSEQRKTSSFPAGVPIVGREQKPVMRIKVNEEVVEIKPPPTDAQPEQIDAFGSLCAVVLMTQQFDGQAPWPDVLAQAVLSYRGRFQPVVEPD